MKNMIVSTKSFAVLASINLIFSSKEISGSSHALSLNADELNKCFLDNREFFINNALKKDIKDEQAGCNFVSLLPNEPLKVNRELFYTNNRFNPFKSPFNNLSLAYCPY
ncbi:hypothetical protein FACS1894113_3370 [Alphaproteobacteria bacterium]|nr:hypothetical protein FACS1894113_3370 [Alphaproteobacteria bacterium]